MLIVTVVKQIFTLIVLTQKCMGTVLHDTKLYVDSSDTNVYGDTSDINICGENSDTNVYGDSSDTNVDNDSCNAEGGVDISDGVNMMSLTSTMRLWTCSVCVNCMCQLYGCREISGTARKLWLQLFTVLS